MNSFSFSGSGSDLLDEYSGWMDCCKPPVSTKALCFGLNHDQTVAHDLFTGMMNRCHAGLSFFAWVSLKLPELDSKRDGREELIISILQSAKCWTATQAEREGRTCLLLSDIYVCRKTNVTISRDGNERVTISCVNISDPKFLAVCFLWQSSVLHSQE